jgi:hypothetical protein
MSNPPAQQYFQDALTAYQSLPALDINGKVAALDTAINTYHKTTTPANKAAVQAAFAPIATYYATLNGINTNLTTYLNKVSTDIADSQDTLMNEERYGDRVNPEETTAPREIMYGLFPKFRQTSLPYILTTGVFMSLLTIFIVFQLMGITGQVNLPPTVTQFFTTPAGVVNVPFYKNPMVLGGLVTILASALVIFIILYYKAKNTNNP